jgi:glycosyltransferase involved in cell wall biosynthesis
MKIFVTADPGLPVPPRLYGGIERVIALLADGLHVRGHGVTLFADQESAVACELVPYPGRDGSARSTAINAALIAREARRRRPDVIHSFGRLASLLPLLPWRLPKVMSYQRQVTPRTVRWGRRLAGDTLSFTGCSRRLIEPVAHLGRWSVVYNAVPLDRYHWTREVAPDAPLVFLGRLEFIKGPHVAVEVARRAGRRLILAGTVPEHPEARRYFRETIESQIDGRTVVYAGPVDDAAKDALLRGAAALLMPVLWDEPFGIVMAEALACGTPVVGFDRGAVPEVVEHGVTGFVCRTAGEMADAVARLPAIGRDRCRAAAERRFSPDALVGAYEALYKEVACGIPTAA